MNIFLKPSYCLLALFYSLSAFSEQASKPLENSQLQLCNSTDVKVMFLFEVGHAKLFLPNCENMGNNEYMLSITYNRTFTADEFIKSSNILIELNNTTDIYKSIKAELDDFNKNYQAVEKGDEYSISYTYKNGFNLEKNGTLVSSSNNQELAKAYFKVWFGDEPFNKKMKKNLLSNIKIK